MTHPIQFTSAYGFDFTFDVTFDKDGVIYKIMLGNKDRTAYFEKLPAFMAELKDEVNNYVSGIPDYSDDDMAETYRSLDNWLRNGG